MNRIPIHLYKIAEERARRLASKVLYMFDMYNDTKEKHYRNIKIGMLGEELIRYLYTNSGWQVEYGDGVRIDLIARKGDILRYNEIKVTTQACEFLPIPLYRHIKVDKRAWYVWLYINDSYYTVLGCISWKKVDKLPPMLSTGNGIKYLNIPTVMLQIFRV